MKWEKIEYPWKGINIPNSEIDLRMKLFDDFVTYFGFDRMARAGSVGSYERLLNTAFTILIIRIWCL